MRLLTGEPPKQMRRAHEYLQELQQEGQVAMVSDLVVSEAYFALHAHYGVPKSEAVKALLDFLRSGFVTPEPGGRSVEALTAIATARGKPGFVDRMIHAQYLAVPAQVASFETAFRRLPNTVILT
jgi:predicted nucleic acid-binding protein